MSKLILHTAVVAAIRKVLAIKTSGRWNNQIDNEGGHDFPLTACFVGLSEIIWITEGNQQQKGTVTITLHYMFEKYDTGNDKKDNEIFAVIEDVHQEVQGLSADVFNPLQRVEERDDDDHDNVIHWEADYTCLLIDCTTARDRDLVDASPVTPEVDAELKIDNIVIRTGDFD